jgi:hypothetical protein
VYRVETDALAESQTEALPSHALPAYAELRTLLEVNPWAGDPINEQNPEAEVRSFTFGPNHEDLATFLILENQRRVDILDVTWLD